MGEGVWPRRFQFCGSSFLVTLRDGGRCNIDASVTMVAVSVHFLFLAHMYAYRPHTFKKRNCIISYLSGGGQENKIHSYFNGPKYLFFKYRFIIILNFLSISGLLLRLIIIVLIVVRTVFSLSSMYNCFRKLFLLALETQ